MLIKCKTTNFKQTQKLGKSFAKKILNLPPKKTAVVLGLTGNLGGGKTTFLQGFAKGLGIKDKITSPTFVIYKKFSIKAKIQCPTPNTYYHFDCYRINNPKEILGLGFREIISNPKNIVAIEWPERIKKIIPKGSIEINFGFAGFGQGKKNGKNKREINFKM